MIIKLEKFEGPLHLLLSMIEQEKMAITEISLLKIADQYIDYIKTSPDITMDNIADFLVVAAKLLLIKSKALLPYLSPEEEEEIVEFQEQLKMYQELLQATKQVAKLAGKKTFMFSREFDRKAMLASHQGFSPPQQVAVVEWPDILREVVSRWQPAEPLEEASIMDNIKIEDRIDFIRQQLSSKLKFVFSHVIEQASSKTEVIVSFLAILELMKQRDIIIEQAELFGEIEINQFGVSC